MDKWLYRFSIALALLGLAVSIYMTIFKITNNPHMCVGNHGCMAVNASSYSELDGIPVAVIGMGGYAVLAGLLLLEPRAKFLKSNSTLVVFTLALLGFLFTLYLIYVEVALIQALCPFCLTSQVTMTILFILSVIRLVRQPIH
jgi:uncharacterized membrane protein